jgi:nicotinamide mononucleotide (NMN) deamidase PncC
MLPDSVLQDAESLLAACRAKGIMVATAESCTGGLIAAALTAIAGSSDVVDRGFGLVCFGLASTGKPVTSDRQIFPGDRTAIRAATVVHAFKMISAAL